MPNRGNINGKRFEHEISISLKNISPWPFPRLLDGGSRNSTPVPFDFLVLFPNGEIAGFADRNRREGARDRRASKKTHRVAESVSRIIPRRTNGLLICPILPRIYTSPVICCLAASSKPIAGE